MILTRELIFEMMASSYRSVWTESQGLARLPEMT